MNNMYKFGFIGMGSMGSSMMRGCLSAFDAGELAFTRKDAEKGQAVSKETGVPFLKTNSELAAACSCLILAVKPVFYPQVLEEIRPYLTKDHILLGLAPGKTMKWMRETAGGQARAARIMPNMPASVGAGMTPLCVDADIRDQERELLTAV
jgi:pyrroline-5-carboxylate reductase